MILPVGIAIRAAFVAVEVIGFAANLVPDCAIRKVADLTLGKEEPFEYQGSTTPERWSSLL